MKVSEIDIKNYRSLRDVNISTEEILALIGRNNVGKSNVIKALRLFFEGSTRWMDEECYFNCETEEPIRIQIRFEELNDWEKEIWEDSLPSWYDKEKLVLGKEFICTDPDSMDIEKENFVVLKIPEPEWLLLTFYNTLLFNLLTKLLWVKTSWGSLFHTFRIKIW
ncbi:hypothetical protein AKJ62_01910 [candidate division MSBL1 archaeon SCGC-AAA259D14]|uniref:Endonuclease GajA/Old nuclease/RecF-like AAA domain-containing protein n=1 Tax=candidate division MSBL1 archaeon SCGC-AAA259D14 TaxID=1698261 RepID=A0A133U731_9EURY|nr:hypothetical protein AKJ62_01910 [candidate division MSBL1 archaeon SCGC-AAA259D14]